jgi:hypothetical protein
MRKKVFLIVSAMAILFSGCTASRVTFYSATGHGLYLINPNSPTPLDIDENRGIRLPMSTRSSLSIDVECILDYVQGESTFGPQDERNDFMNPWVRLNLSF